MLTVKTTRLAFVDVPRLLRDVVAGTAARQLQVEVVTDELDPEDVAAGIAACAVDVLVAGARFDEPQAMARLLEAFPRLTALVVIGDGREVAVYERVPSRQIRELSTETLAMAVEASRAHWKSLPVRSSPT